MTRSLFFMISLKIIVTFYKMKYNHFTGTMISVLQISAAKAFVLYLMIKNMMWHLYMKFKYSSQLLLKPVYLVFAKLHIIQMDLPLNIKTTKILSISAYMNRILILNQGGCFLPLVTANPLVTKLGAL